MTRIEWTEATWNPIVGCSVVSPGCTNCYAMRQAHRMASNPATPQYHGTTRASRGGPVWSGKVALAENVLLQPLHRQKPTTWFVNSMGDLFHEDVPDEWIDRVFAIMARTPWHTYQVLTKRAERMRYHLTKLTDDGAADRLADSAARYLGADADAFVANYINGWSRPAFTTDDNPANGTVARWPLPNVWLGVSAEDQVRADERIPPLLDTPAAIRFVSCEPLLGPVDFNALSDGCEGMNALTGLRENPYGAIVTRHYDSKLHWVIVGGESGHDARPMHPDWARSLRDQCAAADVPFFFKQVGAWTAWEFGDPPYLRNSYSRQEKDKHLFLPEDMDDLADWDDGLTHIPESKHAIFQRVGKRKAGRLLDGVVHDGVPAR